jgi:LDH2 family malate/lactate/ureidoglycolate dehydrogenase
MAIYPPGADEPRIPVDVLRRAIQAIFSAAGMGSEAAQLVADSIVYADKRGNHSHGVLHVPDYVSKLLRGGVDPRAEPRLVASSGPVLKVDVQNAMGQIGMAFAMKHTINRAADMGVAFAAVGGSNHCGALNYFSSMAARRGMIGICGTNAIPTMAPNGGRDRIVGLNPISIAIPGNHGDFVLDTTFGEAAYGKIRVYGQKGHAIPEGWVLDSDGQPTTDPTAAFAGLIRPIGGHKGVGLGMAVGMISSLLSGAAYGTELGDLASGAKPGRDGHFCLVIDINAFQPLDEVRARVDRMLEEVRGGRRREGVNRLYSPGELGDSLDHEYSLNGIPLNRETLAGIAKSAEQVGADISELEAITGVRTRAGATRPGAVHVN